ncbi:Uncharacterized protein YbiU [Cytospora mali]|uniref:Uncharacterized protein YbiU n=1 Tax=Cytospora mali TaxID=578113 RepID=A0A194W0P7_CYTMA|nr:Uncharacterized protein YbiU [Valsa mali]
MPVTTQTADTAGSSTSTTFNSSNPSSSGRTARIITTVKLSGPRPRPPIRRSSRSGSSVFSTKNLTAAVSMVSAKQAPLNPKPKQAGSSNPVPPSAGPSHRKPNPQHRISKPTGSIGSRKAFAKIGGMEPPVQSFYGAEPIALPTRFANIKRRLIQGKEDAIEASWRRLLVALKDEIAHIHAHGTDLIPAIDFSDINDPEKVADFEKHLKRYGVAVVRGVVSQTQTTTWISETREYITRNRDHIKPPVPQDPTCFDLFWTPAQCAIRAHPAVLRVQKWAMSFWETKAIDADISRVATRFPISYADRLRIHDGSIMGTNAAPPQVNGNSAADSLTASSASTLIAQVDNGSLERWEPDGYGRGGAYEAIFRGDWESFDPWDPSGRINVTQDLYNGAGSCSIFRMFQGVLALTSGEPASIRVLPSPKLVAAYFLLRPFFSSKTKPPSSGYDEEGAPAETLAEWAAFLDPDNWTLDSEQSTIIHGAVPGHAQRITELWHPHLRLRRSLVEIPTLQAGDYVIWHCDEAYSIMTTAASQPGTPGPDAPAPSMLIYTPACPLTQTNALFLARQRKAFLQGQPGPDFDSAGGSTMGSEAPHEGRPGMEEIAAVGGDAGLRAMGLAPWELSPDGSRVMTTPATRAGTPAPAESVGGGKAAADGESPAVVEKKWSTEGEAEVVRLANIILFPDRYDFYIPSEKAGSTKERINGKAQAEQMAATRQLISRILT